MWYLRSSLNYTIIIVIIPISFILIITHIHWCIFYSLIVCYWGTYLPLIFQTRGVWMRWIIERPWKKTILLLFMITLAIWTSWYCSEIYTTKYQYSVMEFSDEQVTVFTYFTFYWICLMYSTTMWNSNLLFFIINKTNLFKNNIIYSTPIC